ncbi:GSCFA domain-containing protein [Imperialibacter roseus]|uniref:GSCFA domain-containing protein n=1 Tax=Imperialibacter roseus TaxID=1324217 RepID=A0ABZ0IUD4_9BACT|nr:GSCFA domain-containing protein [Imperialibacter roseus]WOK07311.1 GSCFA domain-containing protein [Imperialibacter roseus]
MFRTEISTTPHQHLITHQDSILTMGSCFADVMGNRLAENKFSVDINPFGTVYNPVSIFKLLSQAASNTSFTNEGIVESQGIYQHFDLHSKFGKGTKEELQAEVQQLEQKTTKTLADAKWLIVTLGTAVVYERSGEIVANCHKVSASQFSKRILSVKEVIRAYENVRNQLFQVNSGIQMIVTVSPVRHVKDTLVVNSQSKSILRVAVAEMTAFPEVSYFPSYEVMMDDLRDYRFYEKDMIHPNETAHDYIWEKFSGAYFDEPTRQLILKWQKLKRNLEHKPFHPASAHHQAFLKKTMEEMEQLSSQLNLEQEIQALKKEIL